MKKVLLPEDQLKLVINLREKGMNWVKIERETGIRRRIAKREYEDWQRKQSQAELHEVRKQVAAEEFRLHIDLLSKMANLLVDSLRIPDPISDIRGGDEVIEQALTQDIYQEQSSMNLNFEGPGQEERLRRLNGLLFKSLQEHTERTAPWGALDNWKHARDSCVKLIRDTSTQAGEIVCNILKQSTGLKSKLEQVNISLQNITDGIIAHLWLNNVRGIKGDITLTVGTSAINKGTAWIDFHGQAPNTRLMFASGVTDNVTLAKEVKGVIDWAIQNLEASNSGLTKSLTDDIDRMQRAADSLDVALNPLVLRRTILNTRCSICPI